MHPTKEAQNTEAQKKAPQAKLLQQNDGAVLYLYGEWSVYTLQKAKSALSGIVPSARTNGKAPFTAINIENVIKIDTSGAMLINGITRRFADTPKPALINTNPDFQVILEISRTSGVYAIPKDTTLRIIRTLNNVGYIVINELRLLLSILSFFGEFNIHAARNLVKPRGIRFTSIVYHLEQVGVKAVPIVALLNFLIGMVIAYMAASSLSLFGAQIYVVSLLEIVTLREMAVLITSILVAGRSGSAFTAQIGAMVNNQEIEAMRSMGIDPMSVLVLPRLTALAFSLPCLVIVADIMSLAGGMIAVWASMDISPTVFINTLHEGMKVKHIMIGVIKAPFFAVVIGCVGCFLGFRVTGSSDSLGTMTTRSVVESIFLVITLDALFALSFTTVGI